MEITGIRHLDIEMTEIGIEVDKEGMVKKIIIEIESMMIEDKGKKEEDQEIIKIDKGIITETTKNNKKRLNLCRHKFLCHQSKSLCLLFLAREEKDNVLDHR